MLADVPAPEDYPSAVRAATRELKLYEGLSTALLLRAVRLDGPMRRALEAQRAHLLLLEPTAAAERLAASLAEATTSHVFVFSADSQWRSDLRFGFGEDTPWRLRLFSAGEPCPGQSVEKLTPTPMDNALHPFHNGWSELYIARFDAACGETGPLVLQVTGPHGAGELGWRGVTAE
jgi:hypothetical protein